MSLIHPGMLWLALLGLIPVVLHWLMRPQPKQLPFPALRLIQLRKKQNSRRLRMRHLALLLLRVGVVLGIVLTLARPRVPSAGYLPTPSEWIALVAILLMAVIASIFPSRKPKPGISSSANSGRNRRLRTIGISTLASILILGFVIWPWLTRIRADAQGTLPAVNSNVPVAAALLFDTSLSMDYQHQGKTRLEVAREIAVNHLNTLPRNSHLALSDTSTSGQIRFTPDLSMVTTRISRLATQAVAAPLDEKILTAVEAHQTAIENTSGASASSPGAAADDFVREIYLFTDLSRGGWTENRIAQLAEKLKAAPQVGLYLIDVAAEQPTDLALNNLKLSETIIPLGGDVRVSLNVQSATPTPSEVQLALYLQSVDSPSELVKQEQISVTASASNPASAEFLLKNVQGKLRQGEVRLTSSDPLQFDDFQRFTLQILPPIKMLVISDLKRDAEYWINALAPRELQQQGRTSIICDWKPSSALKSIKLNEYSAVSLVNVQTLSNDDWDAFEAFVFRGGGLAVFLGKEVDAASYFVSQAALRLLPAELYGHAVFDPPQFLDLEPGRSHPLLKIFAERQITTLPTAEVRRYWRVVPTEGATTVIRYGDDKFSPALLERNVGKGRVLLCTTGISRQGWSELPVLGWHWVALADQMARYLAQTAAINLNYHAGESILVPLAENVQERSFLLRKPAGQQLPVNAPPEQRSLLLNDLDQLGSYRLVSSSRESDFETGFSVNYAPRENDLVRIPDSELDQRLGKDRYRVVRSLQDLERTVRTGRIGVEALPEFFSLLVLFFIGELALSNFFYREEQQARTLLPSNSNAA